MTALTLDVRGSRAPALLWTMAGLGVLWNLYGIYQFIGTLTPAGRSAMAAGMTAAQAQIYFSLPAWMTAAFAVGVCSGLLGSLALAARRTAALPIFAVSLAGYIGLFVGDMYFGVFDAMPGQLAILALVVLVAVALFATAWVARAGALLR